MIILQIKEGGGPRAQAPACSQQALENPRKKKVELKVKNSWHWPFLVEQRPVRMHSVEKQEGDSYAEINTISLI
uniref:Uncharacterized protein n=1 Tax=Romanomermis culicivorax TaxID=13658 RepID=A0A915HEU8_ROMCU